MRNRIALKLFLLFGTALVIFALIVGGSFAYLFKRYTVEVKSNDLEQRAVRIAQALSTSRQQLIEWQEKQRKLTEAEQYAEWQGFKERHGMRNQPIGPRGIGYYSVLRFLGSAAAEDVWVVDEENNLFMPRPKDGPPRPHFLYRDLPPDAEAVVQKVKMGETARSEQFSQMLKVPTITVGVPILDKNSKVLGAVLVHSPLSGMEQAARQGTKILLVCGCGSLILAGLVAFYFAYQFTRPLRIMQETAEVMAEGDYTVRSNVRQHDEVGDLGRALDSLGVRLDEASKESAKLDQLRKDFIANISHELRTPVTVIRGSLEALSDKIITEPAEVEEYYAQMLAESIYLQGLINDLLDLSRLQNVNFQIEKYPVNVCAILRDVERSSRGLSREKNVRVELSMDCEAYMVQGDYGRLRQMLLIFLDNAVKFSHPGEAVRIIMAGSRLEIADKGQGIAAKDLPYIFERFYKTRSEKNKSGTGLGLAIAREIAERHDMHVHMESVEGSGATVVVDLPPALQGLEEGKECLA